MYKYVFDRLLNQLNLSRDVLEVYLRLTQKTETYEDQHGTDMDMNEFSKILSAIDHFTQLAKNEK